MKNAKRLLWDMVVDMIRRQIRPGYWLIDQQRGVLSNSVRVRSQSGHKIYLWRSTSGYPVLQYYFLEGNIRMLTHREEWLCRFLDGRFLRAASWIVMIVAALYFGTGTIVWILR